MEGTYWLCKHDWRCRSNRNRPASCSPSAVHRSITRQLALIPQRLIWCMRLTGYLRSLLSLAVAGLRLTFPNPGSQLSVIAFVSWWTWWGCRLSTKGQTPARSTLSTTFFLTCWKTRHFAAQSGLVPWHHLHSRRKRLFVLGGDHWLGDPLVLN